ncbi:MAG: glycosyltransferase family 1 protein [Victivallaceae bacterium]|jgi:glycosyltransferase involved in cell wall biosynthesis
MYRILISGMAYDGGKSGISVYMNNMIRELARRHQVYVVMLKSDIACFPSADCQNINFIEIPDLLRGPLINMFWHLLVLPFMIMRGRYDFIFLPAANRRAFLFYPFYTIAVVHDLSQYHIPGKYDLLRMLYIKLILPFCVRRTNQLIAVSNSTRDDLIKFWKIPPAKISVIYNGYDRELYSSKDINETQYNPENIIEKNYILYISRIEHPGKNHLNLIKAYEKLPEPLRNNYDLVLAGSFWQGSEPVKEYAEHSFCRDSIKFPGYINNAVLPSLYRKASLYVFPSLFEGFGLSLLEAMACGIPIACSNNSSLAEVAGDAALKFDPFSIHQITECMESVLSNKGLRDKMIQAGLERIKDFDWRKNADKVIELYEKRSE